MEAIMLIGEQAFSRSQLLLMLFGPSPDPDAARRRVLRSLLRSWRSAVDPGHVALPARKRRGPGLSREDVAELAGLILCWYTLFEGGSPKHQCSPRAVDRIADALRLSDEDRAALSQHANVVTVPRGPAKRITCTRGLGRENLRCQ